MKTKYVCLGLISLYFNVHNNRTRWSTNLLVKSCRWGKRKKSPDPNVYQVHFESTLRPQGCLIQLNLYQLLLDFPIYEFSAQLLAGDPFPFQRGWAGEYATFWC